MSNSNDNTTPFQQTLGDENFMDKINSIESGAAQLENEELNNEESHIPTLEQVEQNAVIPSDNTTIEQNITTNEIEKNIQDDEIKVDDARIDTPDVKSDETDNDNSDELFEYLKSIGITSVDQIQNLKDNFHILKEQNQSNPLTSKEAKWVKENEILENSELLSIIMAAKDGNIQGAIKELAELGNVNLEELDLEKVETIDKINTDELKEDSANTDAEIYLGLLEKNISKDSDYLSEHLLSNVSIEEFSTTMSNPQLRTAIQNHINSGAIEHINERIKQIESNDYSLYGNGFSSLPYFDKYYTAAAQLQEEHNSRNKNNNTAQNKSIATEQKQVVDSRFKNENELTEEQIARNLGATHQRRENVSSSGVEGTMNDVNFRLNADSETYNKFINNLLNSY